MLDFHLNGDTYGFLNPYLIAEIGVNHGGDLDRAKKLIKLAHEGGAHAAKFQTYKADKLASKETAPAYWDTNEEPTKTQHELFSKYDGFGKKEYEELAEYCNQLGIDFLSTPFDLDAVDELDLLMPVIKIASADLTNIPLLRKVASKQKPVLLSVGASSHEEIERSVEILLSSGASSLTLLHCVLNYPTPKEHAQLAQIPILIEKFGDKVSIGYSDHVRPNDDGTMPALETAALAGARVIEKHFTDDKTAKGNDHYHAMNSEDLRRFTERLTDYKTLQGGEELDLEVQQMAIGNARRRIFAKDSIAKDSVIDEDSLMALRGNQGLEISNWDSVIGKKATRDISEGEPIKESDFS
jgi:N-acetylneuraminate synthase